MSCSNYSMCCFVLLQLLLLLFQCMACLPFFGISTSRLRNLVNKIGWSGTLKNLDLVFRVLRYVSPHQSELIVHNHRRSVRAVFEGAECVYLDPSVFQSPSLFGGFLYKLPVSYTMNVEYFVLHSQEWNGIVWRKI